MRVWHCEMFKIPNKLRIFSWKNYRNSSWIWVWKSTSSQWGWKIKDWKQTLNSMNDFILFLVMSYVVSRFKILRMSFYWHVPGLGEKVCNKSWYLIFLAVLFIFNLRTSIQHVFRSVPPTTTVYFSISIPLSDIILDWCFAIWHYLDWCPPLLSFIYL